MGLTPYADSLVAITLKAKELDTVATKAISEANKLIKQCENALENCKTIKEIVSETTTENEAIDNIEGLVYNDVSKIQSSVYQLYNTTFAPLTWNNYRDRTAALLSDYMYFNKEIEGILAFYEDNLLLIKLPILGERFTRSIAINRTTIPIDYCSFFTDSLTAALLLIENKIPKFKHKNIQYLFVYPVGEQRLFCSDNHDTKSITDAITSFMIGGDSPMSCSFSYLTTQSNAVPEGTYVTVSSGFGISPDFNEILAKWETLLR